MVTRWKGTWFIAVSDAVRREMCAYYDLPADRVITVRNGIDVDDFADESGSTPRSPQTGSRGSFVIGTAARLVPGKGLEGLLDAIAQLHAQGVRCELRVAGDGSLRSPLAHLSERLNVAASVTFLGHVHDMRDFYRRLDMFVLPSSSEGLPLSLLEAMAAGVPVVASHVGGIPEVIVDGVHGLLVEPDNPSALIAAMKRLATDPGLRHELACAAAARVASEFTAARVAREVTRVYEAILSQ